MLLKHIILAAAIAIAFLFIAFVWPTQYRYEKLSGHDLIRINRFTSTTERLDDNGWQEMGSRKADWVVEAPRVEAPFATQNTPQYDPLGINSAPKVETTVATPEIKIDYSKLPDKAPATTSVQAE